MIERFVDEYRWLSNFWLSSFEYEGVTYKSVEHAYQAAKATTQIQHDRIAAASTPGNAKRMGKSVRMRPDWNEVRDGIMYELVSAKFTQNEGLGTRLFLTDDQQLVEGNHWHDTYWGKCYCPRHHGTGQNKLGEILMRVRDEIQNPRTE